MRKINLLLTALLSLVMTVAIAQPEGKGPGCYAKCVIPDKYETVTEDVMTRAASTSVRVVPATYETASERVLNKEASSVLSVTDATFDTVTETVKDRDASVALTISNATFNTATERVIAKENAPNLKVVPAQWEQVTETVLVKEAYTTLQVVPAQFETVTEEVQVKPAYSELRVVPATYETVTEQILLKEGYTRIERAPAVTDLTALTNMLQSGGNSYTLSNGNTITYTSDELAALRALAGSDNDLRTSNVRLSADSNGNVFATMTEQTMEKAGYSTIQTFPAQYTSASERKMTKAASTRIERVPAKYVTETVTIEVEPAGTKWVKKRADGNCLSANPEDCIVWCLVEKPARYETVTKQVRQGCDAGWTDNGDYCTRVIDIEAEYADRNYQALASDARSETTAVAARMGTRTWEKLIVPAKTVSVSVPAEMGTRTYQKVATPETTERIDFPAQTQTRTYQRLVSPATTTVTEVPAEMGSRTYMKLVSDASYVDMGCGSSVILKNINFRTGSAVLTQSSYAEISNLESMLKNQPELTASIIGHTDSDGSEASNMTLSNARAKAVYDVLVSNGIASSRLSYMGKGESAPIASNATAAGKAQNRRTELVTYGSGEGDCTVYTDRTYQTLASDAAVSSTEIPEVTSTRSYQVLASDAAVSSTPVEAVYGTYTYQALASAATLESSEVPAQFKTVRKTVLAEKGGTTEWREVVCDTDITPALYRRVQQALIDRGYNVGASGADGVFGAASKAALTKFQKDNNLPIGQMNLETMRALGVQ